MRSAQQESEEKGSNQFEKLRQEHIVLLLMRLIVRLVMRK